MPLTAPRCFLSLSPVSACVHAARQQRIICMPAVEYAFSDGVVREGCA